MDAEKLFEHAVRLVEANLNAGQFHNPANLETIIRDQVPIAFRALEIAWAEVVGEGEGRH
ncbi:hypothetical protein [Stappia sp. TSB10P1A]|uniref:hypothetical protein n=1 Tax=Stappia sp. TSB10P1A TaxID=2003585 RepID=UPI001643AB1B|nr:hypothetical protein [Stappia sp. TSB10P1A]